MTLQAVCAVSVTWMVVSTAVPLLAQETLIRPGSRIYIGHMDGFEKDLTVALIGSNVPVVIVKEPKDAELEITGRYRQFSRRSSGIYSTDSWSSEATLTITQRATGVVIDAYTLSEDSIERLARACAKRFQSRMDVPPPKPAATKGQGEPAQPVAEAERQPQNSALRLFVQGDLSRLSDFIDTLTTELRAAGAPIQVVQRSQEYDYNVVFVLTETNAAAVALDNNGILVASVVDTGFRVKGVTEGAARKLAKQLANLKPR